MYQPPYQYLNKGTYGSPGGIIHAGQHAIGTMIILVFFTNPLIALALSVTEMIVHYHIDWAKMNINKIKGWACNTHDEFWIFLGFDQFLHYLTYIVIISMLVI